MNCYLCDKKIITGKQFEVLGKMMCSTKCCAEYREKEEAKKPKPKDDIYHKPDVHCSCD
jgi:hypothetical protein